MIRVNFVLNDLMCAKTSYARDDRAQTLASSDYVSSLVQKAVDEGVPPEKIIVGGFSQGGVVALTAALRSDKKLVRGE